MKIVRLKLGELAPEDSDRVTIMCAPSGRYEVTGICEDEVGRGAAVFSILEEPAGSDGEAEAAGIRWASRKPISLLYIERPLPKSKSAAPIATGKE